MNKRERVLHLAHHGTLADDYVPAAFFLHFPEACHAGPAAVAKHVEYFQATGNDLVKIQYEHNYPRLEAIRRSRDWAKMPCYGAEFYADQLDVVDGVVTALKNQAVVMVTLYSPFMFAGQTVGEDALVRQMEEDPVAVSAGLETIVESMSTFVDGCIRRGVDGFYASTQGGEAGRFSDPTIFDRFVKPTDLAVWDGFVDRTQLNVLHVCDYVAPYESLERYIDYPGHIVSAPTELTSAGETRHLTGAHVAERFGRPFLGGMERLGVISTGPRDEVRRAARGALEAGPAAMILGADCTMRADTDWSNIAAATEVAHAFGGG
jgi:uroporphyrinogen decarboxylase